MNWPTVKLDNIFDVARGGSPRPIDSFITDDINGVNWIMIGDTQEGEKYIIKTNKKIRADGVKHSRAVKEGDFLLTNSMSFGRPYILKTSGCIHDGWLVLSPKSDQIHRDYFYHYLGSESIKKVLASKAAGAVVKNLNKEIVQNLEIPFPPLEEQKRIAAILDKADAIRRKRQEAIKLTDEFLRAVFLDMFGDPVTNPKGWQLKKWGDFGVLKIVNGKNQKQVLDEFGKYPIIGSGGEMGRANDYLCPENTIVIGRKGNINKPLLIREKFWNVDTAFGLVPNSNILSFNYLYWFCIFFDFERLNKTVTIPSLTKSDLLEINIPIPSKDLQDKFDLIVKKIFRMQSKQTSSINLSNDKFNALSNRLFKNEN